MNYAKLINGVFTPAPNPILHNGNWIGNPPAEIYEVEGYKPVRYTDTPAEPGEGYQWVESWSETGDEIVQGWVLVEETDASADEAIEYLFGGDS